MYIIIKFLLYGIAFLPISWLYKISELCSFIIYNILRYKRKIVKANLVSAFPGKSEEEINQICWQFYKNMADIGIETIKALKISKEELQKRVAISENEASKRYFSQQGSSIIMSAHFGNWEWAELVLGQAANNQMQVSYLKLNSKCFNAFMKSVRTRFGNQVVDMKYVFKHAILKNDDSITTFYLADLNPKQHHEAISFSFLNQSKPFFTGPEKLALRLGLDVYFTKIIKVKRGYYRVDLMLISDNNISVGANYITTQYAKMLENSVVEQPECWAGLFEKQDY